MRFLRNRLSWLAAGWLAIQLGALAAPPIVLQARTIIVSEDDCTCPPGTMPGQQCPMHRDQGSNHGDSNRCAMRSAFTQSDAALFAFAAPGFVPTAQFLPHVLNPVQPVMAPQATLSSRSELPDPPPPRV